MFSIDVNKNSESTAIKINAIYLIIVSILLINNFENVSATHTHSDSKSNQQTGNPILSEKCHLIPNQDQLVFTNFYPNSLMLNSSGRFVRNTDFRVKRDHSSDHFVIFPHYHESFNDLPKPVYELYKNRLIPEAIGYWENSLKVKYPYSPIHLGRLCATSKVYFSESSKSVSCELNCATQTKCGDYIVIPEEHLDICRYCSDENNCKEKGAKHEGVKADFILYISSINTEHCNISNTVAFASYCQLESKYNRPVAGYVNICPHSVSLKKSDVHSALATLKHEILHALGFSAGLYAFFLDSNGEPMTKRDPLTGKPAFNSQTNMYEPSERVVKNVLRKNWKINGGFINRQVTMIVTPKVVEEVRKHFDCDELEGAELEDQGEIGTKFTHWEKRVFENEAMTGTYTQNSAFSRITFAFLEDTGWYTVNYSNAEELTWGKSLGCDFAMKSCKHWIDEKRSKGLPIRPFCDNLPNNGKTMASKYECNSERDAVLLCNLMHYKHTVPHIYRNFDPSNSKNNKHPHSSHLGGSVVLADYCPFMQQVSWSINDEVRDSKCTFEENKPDKNKNYILEEYGENSKCFLHNRTWQIYTDQCRSRITVSKTIGCYNYKCDTNQGLLFKVNDQYFRCAYKGQVVDFTIFDESKEAKNSNIYFGNIVCPSCEEICKNEITCPTEQHSIQLLNSNEHQETSTNLFGSKKFTSKFFSFSNDLDTQHKYCLKSVQKFSTANRICLHSFYLYIFSFMNFLLKRLFFL